MKGLPWRACGTLTRMQCSQHRVDRFVRCGEGPTVVAPDDGAGCCDDDSGEAPIDVCFVVEATKELSRMIFRSCGLHLGAQERTRTSTELPAST